LIRQGVQRAEQPIETACGQHLGDLIGVAMRLTQLQTANLDPSLRAVPAVDQK